MEEDEEKKWINIPVPPTFYDSFRVSKVGNFTTGVGKVTNFIFTQLEERVDDAENRVDDADDEKNGKNRRRGRNQSANRR